MMIRFVAGERVAAEDESADQQPNSDDARHASLPAFEWIRILVRAGRDGNRRQSRGAARRLPLRRERQRIQPCRRQLSVVPSAAAALPFASYAGNIARLAPQPYGLKTGEIFEGVSAMGILSWIVLGLIAGFIGSKLVNKTGSGLIMDIVLGVVGAIVGGYISSALGYGTVTGLNLYSIVVAIIGAVVVLLVYRAVVSRS
jgi:uncharacterized membrane protein YeaQ/YmgE (transglycosylase-associated protein family)